MLLRARDRVIAFPRRPLVMGIVNLNEDSFSGDGTLDVDLALRRSRDLLADGADIIDIGAESARTNRPAISEEEEIARLRPFLERFNDLAGSFAGAPFDAHQLWPPLLSINTWRPAVIEAVLPQGGDIINDISALPSARNAGLCAAHGAALLIMHSVGAPKEPHLQERYDNILTELDRFFSSRIALALEAGLETERLILDPGIDFAKQRDDNLRILASLQQFQSFDRPVLLPASRKTVIGETLGIDDPAKRDAGTIALVTSGYLRGVEIFRVHNARATAQALKVLHAIKTPV